MSKISRAHQDAIEAAKIEDAVNAERERCAKIAEEIADGARDNGSEWAGHQIIPREIARRIRSQKNG